MEEYTTKTIHHGPCTIIIQRPVLTAAEQAEREQAVREILGRELRKYYGRKERKA